MFVSLRAIFVIKKTVSLLLVIPNHSWLRSEKVPLIRVCIVGAAQICRSPILSETHALTSKAATEEEKERGRGKEACACVWSFWNSRCSRAFLLRDKAISDMGKEVFRIIHTNFWKWKPDQSKPWSFFAIKSYESLSLSLKTFLVS